MIFQAEVGSDIVLFFYEGEMMKYLGWFKSHHRWMWFFVIVALPVALFFQNCGKAGFDDALSSEDDISALGDDSAGIPFAYDMVLDEIAYNSCANDQLVNNSPGMFTIKAAASTFGGVKLRTDFVNWAKQTLKPEYPNETVTDAQIKKFIGSNRSLSNAVPQLAIRGRQSPQTLFPLGGSSSATVGVDYVNLLGDLADDRWSNTLMNQFNVSPNLGVNFFPLAPGGARIFEGQLSYNKSEAHRNSLRLNLSQSYQLTNTYRAVSGDLFAARAPISASASQAYGRGYNLNFSQAVTYYQLQVFGNMNVWANAQASTLSAVSEVSDLNNPSFVNSNAWSCDISDRYIVVHKDHAAQYCPPENYNAVVNIPLGQQVHEKLRRVLKPEHWDVNVGLRCVVPKTSNCYKPEADPTTGVQVMVQYDAAQPCYVPGSNTVTQVCPQYVSICTRRQD